MSDSEAYEQVRQLYSQISTWGFMVETNPAHESSICLNWIFGTANTALIELTRLALQENPQAIKGLLLIIESNLDALVTMCHQKPELFEQWA
jgi:hypothetical protein